MNPITRQMKDRGQFRVSTMNPRSITIGRAYSVATVQAPRCAGYAGYAGRRLSICRSHYRRLESHVCDLLT